MITGRDDFIIAIRSAFLKKENKQRFSLVGLIFFSILCIILSKINFPAINIIKISIKEIIYRSSFIVSVPENYFKKTYLTIQDHFVMYEEHQKIKDELKENKAKNLINYFIVSENKRLKRIVDDYILQSDEIIAKVLIDKKSPFLRSIIINKGSKDNIKLGMAALENDYLIGKVVEINYLTSRVLLLSDLNSKIPVIIEPEGIQSILSGTGKDYGTIQYLKDDYLLKEGDIIFTSGSGGLFKAGLPIGSINFFKLIDNNRVTFFSDFSQLKFLKIVTFSKEEN